MKALIFSEGNGYGHVARNKIISEHFGIPIMTFGKGAEYCKNSSMDFIEIPTPYVIKTGSGRVRIRPDISELAGFLKHDAMVSLKDQFSKVDFVIVDGSPLALALAMLAGEKSIYITNDTSSLVGVYGLIQKKIAGSLSNKIINSAESVFFAGEPSQATVTIYMPGNVNKIEFLDKDLIITFSTSSGTSKRAFSSRVELSGNINPTEGYKKLLIKAEADKVSVTQK